MVVDVVLVGCGYWLLVCGAGGGLVLVFDVWCWWGVGIGCWHVVVIGL